MLMHLEYYIADPTGNITILVSSQVPINERIDTAARLMEKEKSAEQVGFIEAGTERADITLNMAGGEFCGNAALSAAALYVLERGVKDKVRVKVSGEENPVEVEITASSGRGFEGTVEMPLPIGFDSIMLEYGGTEYCVPVVQFKGISHAVCENMALPDSIENAAKKWCRDLNADAFGIMQIDSANNKLLPYVYVEKSGTGFWESSCASGTTAAGYYLAMSRGCDRLEKCFSEPAGELRIKYINGRLFLSGKVTIYEKKREG